MVNRNSHATTKPLEEPVKCLIVPTRLFAAPKCLILYTPEAAVCGTNHSIVAWLRALSFAGLDHMKRRQKSSSSYTGSQESFPLKISTRANVPSVMRSFLGHADQKTTVTLSPFLKVAFLGTSELTSPNFTPIGVASTTTGVSKLICLLSRSGG